MSTTIQNVMSALRTSGIVPASQVNYGVTDSLTPPYIAVEGFEFEQVYQTCGPATRHSTFHTVCIGKTADLAQDLAQQVFDLLDTSTTLTPTTSACLLLHYRLGQTQAVGTTDKPLYQWAVDMEWRLDENI